MGFSLALFATMFIIALPSSIVSHILFNRHEPRPIHFLAGVISFAFLLPLTLFSLRTSQIATAIFEASLFLAIYLTSLCTSITLYRLSPWHPLARYPGPSLAAVSKWWMIKLILFQGGRHKVLQELHSTYGPWVRVGPNELSINLVSAVNPIYLQLQRSQFYSGIPTTADTLITIVDGKMHSQRRRGWNKALARSALPDFARTANSRIAQLIDIFKTGKATEPVDIHQWISLLLMDTIGDMAFSGGFETMSAGKDKDGWMMMLDIGAAVVAVLGQIPWAREIASLLPQKGPIETFHSFAQGKIQESKCRQQVQGVKRDILSTILNDHHHGGIQLSTDEAAADASLLIASSLETTSQAITTVMRHLIDNETVFKRLQAEIDSAVSVEVEELDSTTLDELKYLDACVREALRILPPAPAGPPRSTGSKGALIVDQYVPPNTTVYVPTYALQRDPENFRDPEVFIPERWLAEQQESPITPHNPNAFIPFSAGFGACVGKQLALQNIKLVVAHLVRQFSIEASAGFSLRNFDDSYKERGLWVHDPLLVKLRPRVESRIF